MPPAPAGSISAHAEEPHTHHSGDNPVKVYLRARGGTGVPSTEMDCTPGLSPRTRRNRTIAPTLWGLPGSISAHAEEPPMIYNDCILKAVYLRARGGTTQCGVIFLPCVRSISAHAEEPPREDDPSRNRSVYLRARGGTPYL
ncbi:Hypothetical protein GbCGDNIH7_7112b [Granulibacter bethesdensis]|nr:Hypothetical protein GbCGDNIH7_7112b [Granulibacter bethesdensis]